MKIEIEIDEKRLESLCHAVCSTLSYSHRVVLEEMINEMREKTGDKKERFINWRGEKW